MASTVTISIKCSTSTTDDVNIVLHFESEKDKPLNIISDLDHIICNYLDNENIDYHIPSKSRDQSKIVTTGVSNDWDNLEHTPTGIVFVRLPIKMYGGYTPVAVGVQDHSVSTDDQGLDSVLPLTDSDIEVCKTKKFRVLTAEMFEKIKTANIDPDTHNHLYRLFGAATKLSDRVPAAYQLTTGKYLSLRENKWDNLEHLNTHIIFVYMDLTRTEKNIPVAVGTQDYTSTKMGLASVSPLTHADISKCEMEHWPYDDTWLQTTKDSLSQSLTDNGSIPRTPNIPIHHDTASRIVEIPFTTPFKTDNGLKNAEDTGFSAVMIDTSGSYIYRGPNKPAEFIPSGTESPVIRTGNVESSLPMSTKNSTPNSVNRYSPTKLAVTSTGKKCCGRAGDNHGVKGYCTYAVHKAGMCQLHFAKWQRRNPNLTSPGKY